MSTCNICGEPIKGGSQTCSLCGSRLEDFFPAATGLHPATPMSSAATPMPTALPPAEAAALSTPRFTARATSIHSANAAPSSSSNYRPARCSRTCRWRRSSTTFRWRQFSTTNRRLVETAARPDQRLATSWQLVVYGPGQAAAAISLRPDQGRVALIGRRNDFALRQDRHHEYRSRRMVLKRRSITPPHLPACTP